MAAEDLRASDREREAATLRLRAAHLEGRIETEELEERIARVQTARTRADLDAVEADLPGRPAAVVGTTSGVPWWPGRRAFSERKLLDAPLEEVREAALAFIVPPLERHGFQLAREEADVLVFSDRRGPAPGGDRITLRLRDAGDRRTLVLAHGTAPLAVRRAFAKLV
jgi:Domain of unknown function (DUF1707)